MYSTKILNKAMVDGNAYITVGDPYVDPKDNPFRQGKKSDKPPFHCKTKPVNEENGYFTKTVYKAGGYSDAIRYVTTQPLDSRKRGFGTKDAKRRDEFSNAIRTEQYRETVRKEMEIVNKNAEKLHEDLERITQQRALDSQSMKTYSTNMSDPDFSYDTSVPQFDIGRTRVTQFNPKAIKDTYYQFDGKRERRLGPFMPESCTVGLTAWEHEYKPPANGGKAETKNFYDKSHLQVGR